MKQILNTSEKNESPQFRLKNIKETRNYFIKEIDQNGLMSNKHHKLCTAISHIKSFLILTSVVFGCISISAFAFLLGIPIGTTSSDIDLCNNCRKV